MPKFKKVALYLAATLIIILLFSSFEAESYFAYANQINISDTMMRRALASDFSTMNSTQTTTYKNGDSDDAITTFKVKLYLLDYMTYPLDNTFDDATESAVRAYQSDRGLTVNGTLDADTQNALNTETIEYTEGQKTYAIVAYKQTLVNLGYLDAATELDGTFTAEMTAAVTSYQQNNGLSVTGTLNKETQDALERDVSLQTRAQ
jgi:peptidoglycan hydrolase-like protein with peptidoglycan-binding domain